MNIRSYFREIRNRLLLLALTWVSAVLVSYLYKETLLFILTQQNFFCQMKDVNEMFYFIFTDVTEIFWIYITLVFFFSNQIFVCYSLYHIFIFMVSGLYKSEYDYLIFIAKTSMCVCFISIIVFNSLLFPFSWNFFSSFHNFVTLESLTLHFEAKLNEYLTFYIAFYYSCILYFQSFVLLILFLDYIKNELKTVRYFRKTFYYVFVIFSTLITPPDVYSQITLSAVIIFSYEILIFYFLVKKASQS